MCVASLLPKSRGRALHNLSGNLSIKRGVAKKRILAHPNAAVAWLWMGGPRVVRFPWSAHDLIGPRAMLMYVSNGPRHFAKKWVKLFVHEVVAKSRRFAQLSSDTLRHIVMLASLD